MSALIRFYSFLIVLFFISCSEAPKVQTVPVVKTRIEATISSVNSGLVKAEQIAELAFGAVGRVKKLNIELGDIVDKDFLIAEIENNDTFVALKSARNEFERQLQLSKKGASSPSAMDQAEAQLRFAEEAYQRTLIKAPFKGQIAELNMEVGQLSQITTEFKKALIRIVDLEPRYIRAEIDEVDLPKVKIGQAASVKILAVRKQPFKARVRKIIPFVSAVREQDRTSEIELSIDENQILPAGASADVEIVVEVKDDVLAVPLRSISTSKGKKYVYRLEDGRAVKTSIETGVSNYDLAEVISGLEKNDIIILPDEKIELIDGMKVVSQ